MHLIFLAGLFLNGADATPATAPQTQTVEVTGEAAVINGDVAAATEEARRQAFRAAVEQVGGTLVSGLSISSNSTLVLDKVVAQSQGWVRHWTPVGEPDIGSSVKLTLRVEVGLTELDKDLEAVKAILAMKGKPRVVTLISEQNVGMAEPFAWWTKSDKEAKGTIVSVDLGTFENTFIDSIRGNGWVFVDHDALEGKLKTGHAFSTDLNTNQAVEFAKLSGAEVAIIGRVVASSAGESLFGPGMFGAMANVSLRAINCDNGEVMATVSKTYQDITFVDPSAQNAGQKALRYGAAKAAEYLQAKVLERWQGEMNGGSARIVMKVSGLSSYKILQDFEGVLGSSVKGVRAVEERSADGSDAELDLDVSGTSKMLARQLDGKSIKGKVVSVKRVSANELDVSLAK